MIVRTRGGGDMQMRSDLGTLLSQYGLGRVGYGASAGVPVTTLTVAGIPAVHKAVTFAAQAVAVLGKNGITVWRDTPAYREPASSVRQARLFRGTPNDQQTWFAFWEAVQASLDFRGNAYIWKSKDADGNVVALYALHPDQVYLRRETVSKRITFRCAFGEAYITPTEAKMHASVSVGTETILHIRGRGGNGELIAPSPITLFRSALGIAVAKQQHEATLFENGVMGGLGVTFPESMQQDKAEKWLELFNGKNAGATNSGRTKVLGGGASFAQIGMTQADAQFIESVGASILDVANIFDVPPWFLGVNEKAEKTQLPEHEETRWVHHGLIARTSRIEAALYADTDLFGPGSKVYPAFNMDDAISGDVTTQDAVAHQQIQDGRLLVDEWRASRGKPPLPDGIGMIPQITPVGGAPNPTLNKPVGSTNGA